MNQRSRGSARGSLRRGGWGLADQAFSSLTNFGLAAMVARSVSQADFGAFSLAFAIYLVFLGIANAVASQPLTLRYGITTEERWREGARLATGTAALIGILGGLACLAVGLIVGDTFGVALTGVGVGLPGLLVQDTWRFAFIARGRGASALANDAVWAVVLFPTFGLLVATGNDRVLWLVLAWAGAATCGALAGMLQVRALPAPTRVLPWLREHRDLSWSFLGEFAAMSGGPQLALFGVGSVAGLVAVGTLRAGQIILGPMKMAFRGIHFVGVPEAVRLRALSVGHLARGALRLSAVGALGGLAGGGLLLLVPDPVGEALLNEAWQPAQQVLPPLTLWLAGSGGLTGVLIGLRALESTRRILHGRIAMVTVAVILKIAGAAMAGATGAAYGMAIASCGGTLLHWWYLRQELRERESAGAVLAG